MIRPRRSSFLHSLIIWHSGMSSRSCCIGLYCSYDRFTDTLNQTSPSFDHLMIVFLLCIFERDFFHHDVIVRLHVEPCFAASAKPASWCGEHPHVHDEDTNPIIYGDIWNYDVLRHRSVIDDQSCKNQHVLWTMSHSYSCIHFRNSFLFYFSRTQELESQASCAVSCKTISTTT